MIVGVPRELKDRENRVSTTPAGVQEYVVHGHTVHVESGAGTGSGFPDEEYLDAGARLIANHEAVFAEGSVQAWKFGSV